MVLKAQQVSNGSAGLAHRLFMFCKHDTLITMYLCFIGVMHWGFNVLQAYCIGSSWLAGLILLLYMFCRHSKRKNMKKGRIYF